jgi:hypothetical protein
LRLDGKQSPMAGGGSDDLDLDLIHQPPTWLGPHSIISLLPTKDATHMAGCCRTGGGYSRQQPYALFKRYHLLERSMMSPWRNCCLRYHTMTSAKTKSPRTTAGAPTRTAATTASSTAFWPFH